MNCPCHNSTEALKQWLDISQSYMFTKLEPIFTSLCLVVMFVIKDTLHRRVGFMLFFK